MNGINVYYIGQKSKTVSLQFFLVMTFSDSVCRSSHSLQLRKNDSRRPAEAEAITDFEGFVCIACVVVKLRAAVEVEHIRYKSLQQRHPNNFVTIDRGLKLRLPEGVYATSLDL